MPQTIDSDKVTSLIYSLLEETFERVNGIYLDGKTSLLETLAGISAAEASQTITDDSTSIASQVDHVRFYIDILKGYMDGRQFDKIDWQGSWSRKSVNDVEWDALRKELESDYAKLRAHLNSFPDWNDDKRLGGALGIIVHTAYHLGAIRQIMRPASKPQGASLNT